MEHTSHRGMIGTTTGMEKEPFTDLDFADDVALLAEMLSVLVLALEVMNAEAQPLGMTINWSKTKIQDPGRLWCSMPTCLFMGMKWRSLSHLCILAPRPPLYTLVWFCALAMVRPLANPVSVPIV